ncbi:DUF4870 domain-containing protein [Brevibacillus sp. B_LB10_24]|uniref:DUF4870 domain-containing protein n=1 Tax=Brevibacillus sp. B_LB10_24 TaxID=3380645 RepID=UPI0038B6DB67
MNTSIPSKDERLWATICHLAAFIGCIIPFGHILGPLVVWLIKREDGGFVDQQGREAVNFNISFSIYGIVLSLLVIILIGVPLLFVLLLAWIVIVIIAAVKANEGVNYRYPLTIRFLK